MSKVDCDLKLILRKHRYERVLHMCDLVTNRVSEFVGVFISVVQGLKRLLLL